jgi:hypothetical protein
MLTLRLAPVSLCLVLAAGSPAMGLPEPPAGAAAAAAPAPASPGLPPVPDGVTPLRFGEFFVRPTGPRGLVYSEKLRRLHGQRVRVLGHMVRRHGAPPGTLLLTPYPMQLHDGEYGLADDLPPSTLFVTVPDTSTEVPFTPGLLLLTGRLEIGGREEPDGRFSAVRMTLDPRPAGSLAPAGPGVVTETQERRDR